MPDDSPTADIPPPLRKRPWWRLHVSTWCLVLLTLAVLAVLNIPGSLPQSSAGPDRSGIAHGWPWTMMERQVEWPDTNDDLAEFLWSWSVQPASDAALAQSRTFVIQPRPPIGRTYYPAAIAGNAAVAIALLAAVAFLAERRRRQRHSFWQITLAEGLIGCAVLTAAFAWVGWLVKNTEQQRAAVDAIHADHGTVCLDVFWESRLPDWWEVRHGQCIATDPILGNVIHVDTILGSADAVLKRLQHLPAVRNLYLGGRPLHDPALLAELKHLHNLQLLDLSRTGVRGQDIKHVAACETLVDLDLSHNPISDEGLKHLHRLRHLRFLNLTNVEVSVEAVDALQAALPELNITDD